MFPLTFYYFKNAVQNLKKKCRNSFTNFNIHLKLTYKIRYLYVEESLSSVSLYYFNKPVISKF